MRRYKGKEVRGDRGDDVFTTGDFYLIEVVPERGGAYYALSREPGRKNMSRAVCTDGWLGTTNNVARYAHGAVRVRVEGGRIRIHEIDVAELAAAEETAAD